MKLSKWEYEQIKHQIEAEQKKRKKRFSINFRLGKAFVISAVILSIFAGLLGFVVPVFSKLALLDVFMTLGPQPAFINECNILVLGIDTDYGTRSDTIMVVHINPEQRDASLVSIPRDTLTNIPEYGLDKINHAFAFGGPELAMTAASKLLDIYIPYYITINVSGLASLIDDIGGITVNVEKRMYYVDYAGNLNINLWPGKQKLNGRQAVAYVRYRSDGGDFKRISRQQKFLHLVASQMMNKENLVRSPNLFFNLVSNVKSNMSTREILGAALTLRNAYELGRMRMTSLPGQDSIINGAYYLKPNQKKLKNIVKEYLHSRPLSSTYSGINKSTNKL